MLNIYILRASVASIVLVATPALAAPCEFGRTVEVNPDLKGQQATNQQAVEFIINTPTVKDAMSGTPLECRPFVVSESLRVSGLAPGAQMQPNTTVRIAIPTSYTPAPSSAPAPQSAPKPAAMSDTGPGAEIDRQIAELQQRAAAGGVTQAEIEALEAKIADLSEAARRDRDAAATRLQQTVTRKGVTPAEIVAAKAAYQRAETKFADAETRLKAVEKVTANNSRRINAIVGKDGKSGMLGELNKRVENLETVIVTETSWWTPQWWWFLIFAIALVGGFIIWWKKFREKDELQMAEPDLTGYVREEQLNAKANATEVTALSKRVDELDARLTDTRDQVGAKDISIPADLIPRATQLEEDGEFTTAVVVKDSASESVTYEVGIRKGADGEVFITSGVKGHTVTNAVKISNLVATLKNAAFKSRLTKKAGA